MEPLLEAVDGFNEKSIKWSLRKESRSIKMGLEFSLLDLIEDIGPLGRNIEDVISFASLLEYSK